MNIQEAIEYLEGGHFENCSGQIVARHEEKRLDHIVCDLTCACSEVMSKNADEAGEVLVTLLNRAMAVPDLLDALERLVHMAECNTLPGPNTLAQARTALAKARGEG